MKSLFFILLCALWVALPVNAHEVRPAYLMLEETADNQFSVLWKTPVTGGYAPRIELVLPEGCEQKSGTFTEVRDGAYIRSRTMACSPEGLDGREISVKGLSGTLIDVIIRISWKDGREEQLLLTPDQTRTVIGTPQKDTRARMFLPMGITHILEGADHLAFVMCLLLFVRRFVPLLKTITAFTLSHSITLFLVSLGIISVPAAPVEAMIALSIVLLAAEALRNSPGPISGVWKMTFVFGLLHGLGFAGALQGIGLPESGVLPALLFFNLGVEIGQLIFVLSVLAILGGLERIRAGSRPVVERYTANLVGMAGVFWVITRVTAFI
ncbi:MAG: HupE/UreJ family protein [Desulfobacterales bacterium]|nr:HupE/UreJ family protein [Desulfobacterales bacterium]